MQPRRQDLWLRLIEAALESINIRGYAATTVSHITGRAQVNRTQFYFLFQDKGECFLAMQNVVIGEIKERVLEAQEKRRDWPTNLRAAIDAVLALFDEQPAIARVALLESPAAGRAAQMLQIQARAELMPYLEASRKLAAKNAKLPDTIGEMALGSASAIIEKELRENPKPKFAKLGPDVLFALLMPFTGPTRAARQVDRLYTKPGSKRKS